jgi:hypothetical protein
MGAGPGTRTGALFAGPGGRLESLTGFGIPPVVVWHGVNVRPTVIGVMRLSNEPSLIVVMGDVAIRLTGLGTDLCYLDASLSGVGPYGSSQLTGLRV